MARALEFHPEAQEEFEAAAVRYAGISSSLGEAATARAVRAPMTGAPMGSSLRRVFVKRFPHFVLYAFEGSRIFMLAVAHFRQPPGFWSRRSAR